MCSANDSWIDYFLCNVFVTREKQRCLTNHINYEIHIGTCIWVGICYIYTCMLVTMCWVYSWVSVYMLSTNMSHMWWKFSCYWFTTTILDVWYFLGPYIICLFVEIFKTCVGAISSVGTFSWSHVNVSNMLTCTQLQWNHSIYTWMRWKEMSFVVLESRQCWRSTGRHCWMFLMNL